MRLSHAAGIAALLTIAACQSEPAEVAPEARVPADAPPVAEAPAPPPGAGTARVALTSDGITVEGEYPARLCGGPYIMGEGFAFQTQADDWQITIASESAPQAGEVQLNTDDGVNVVVTANGPGKQFVRGPSNAGSFRLSDDLRTAEADLELRGVVTPETARLVATFTCN